MVSATAARKASNFTFRALLNAVSWCYNLFHYKIIQTDLQYMKVDSRLDYRVFRIVSIIRITRSPRAKPVNLAASKNVAATVQGRTMGNNPKNQSAVSIATSQQPQPLGWVEQGIQGEK